MADINPALVEKILNISKRKRKANVERRRQANDFRARLEVLK